MRRPASIHPHHLRHQLHYYHQANLTTKFLAIFLSAGILTTVVIFFRNSFGFTVPQTTSLAQIPWTTLMVDAGYTLARLFGAYFVSLILAVVLSILVTAHRRIESLALPVLDVLQSVPVLAFFPIAVIAFAKSGLFEGAAVFVLITGMMWAILFNLIGAIHAIPEDIELAARNFGAKGWRYLWHVQLPATFPALVTGSILAWGAGWNIIIVAEYINFGQFHEVLPGLGSLLDQAAAAVGEGNTTLFIAGLLLIVALVVLLNRLLWQPLLSLAERFKFE